MSRTYTKGARISPQTRQKVLVAARSLDYRPNILARSLMTRRTNLIGLVSNNFDNPAYMEIFDLFTRRLQQHGLRPLLANLSGGTRTDAALDMLLQYNVDGVIIASSTLPPEFVKACSAARLPVVHAFGRPGNPALTSVVGADNVQGGVLAGEILLERGYRSIAFLGGPQTASSTADRLRGLCQSLQSAAMAPVAEVYGHSYSHEAGFTLMRQLLLSGGIDSVFCGDDILAMGAIDACRAGGIGVPRDVGIVGFNDIAMAAWPAYDLTTIRQPIGEIIVAAVETAIANIDMAGACETRVFECRSVIRGTLRPR